MVEMCHYDVINMSIINCRDYFSFGHDKENVKSQLKTYDSRPRYDISVISVMKP